MTEDTALFAWHGFDVRSVLPENWQVEIERVAQAHAKEKILVPKSVTSREASDVREVPVETVGGITLIAELPWLYDLYRGLFRELAERTYGVRAYTAEDPRISINLNVQTGNERRYEAHVDSNPIEGLLYVTSQPPGAGGELVVAHSEKARGIDDIKANSSTLYPMAGHLLFFDARRNPHFVAPLTSPADRRIVVAMNFYTDESPESARPQDLNKHLFGVA